MAFGPEMMLGESAVMLVGALVIAIPVAAFFLWLSAKIFKLRDKSFKTPLIIAAIVGTVKFVLAFFPRQHTLNWIIVAVLLVWLIKKKYSITVGKAALVWLIYSLLSLIVITLIGLSLYFFKNMVSGGMS